MATIACAFNILIISDSLLFFSLSSSSTKLTLPLMFFLPLIPHAPIDTKSTKKINHGNKIVGSVLMEIGDGLMWIGFDGDQ